MKPIEIDTPSGPARAHLHAARTPRGAVVLGHGAGGGVEAADLVAATEGAVETHFFTFAEDGWTTLDALGTPDYPFADALAAVRGFVFVGPTPNVIEFQGLRVDGYEPPCL